MPHVNHSSISPVDEIKVYQDEGEDEEEQKSSAENLKEVKSSLVTEEEEKAVVQIPHPSYLPPKIVHPGRPVDDRSTLPPSGRRYDYLSPPPFSYMYAHSNAALSMVNRVPLVPSNHAPLSLMQMYNPEFQPPPAHIGIPPIPVDHKTGIRTPMYPIHPSSQFHPSMFSHQFPWPPHSMYSLPPSFRSSPYPPSPFPPMNHIPSKFSPPNLSPSSPPVILTHHPPHHSPLVGPKIELPSSQDIRQLPNSRQNSHHHSNTVNSLHHQRSEQSEKKKSHIKKPLNAFMLFMKEQRAQVVAECTLKESAAINQLLGKKWHSLSRDEQSKYYELAKKERQLHMQMYPGWTARDNYAINAKKKKRKKDKSQETDANNPKKCRARFGLDRQSSWCKPCRRKKKCIRYISGSDNTGESEDNMDTPESRCGEEESDSDSGNGDGDSEFSLSSPPVPRRDGGVQSMGGSPAPFSVQPDTPPSTDSSTLQAAVT